MQLARAGLMLTMLAIGQGGSSLKIAGDAGPLRIYGKIEVIERQPGNEYACATRITATNVASKEILLLISRIHVPPLSGGGDVALTGERTETRVDEFVFADTPLQPGATHEWVSILPPFTKLTRTDAQSLKPSGEFEVLFVQFADGSSWGDPALAEGSLLQRKLTLNRLEQLLNALSEGGLDAFRRELLPIQDLPLMQRLREMVKKGEVEEAVTRARQKRDTARRRLALLPAGLQR